MIESSICLKLWRGPGGLHHTGADFWRPHVWLVFGLQIVTGSVENASQKKGFSQNFSATNHKTSDQNILATHGQKQLNLFFSLLSQDAHCQTALDDVPQLLPEMRLTWPSWQKATSMSSREGPNGFVHSVALLSDRVSPLSQPKYRGLNVVGRFEKNTKPK